MARIPRVAELNSRVALCTMQDVVEKDGMMALRREAVAWVWAKVVSRQTLANSFISPLGYTILDDVKRPTYFITIRAETQVEVSSAAWVYERFRKSSPRWYKVVGFVEQGRWIILHTHLYERSDQAQPPTGGLSPQPSRVEL